MRFVKKSNYRESLQSPRRRVTSVDASGQQRVYVTRHVTYLRRSHRGRSSRTIITSDIDEETNFCAIIRMERHRETSSREGRDYTGMTLGRLHVCRGVRWLVIFVNLARRQIFTNVIYSRKFANINKNI